MTTPYSSAPASRPGPEGYPPQASLRDFLNTRMSPFLKKAIKQSLVDEPEYPLRYLGEHLIHQSLQYEADPQKPEIKDHFQYNFDTRPAPAPEQTQEAASQSPYEPQQQQLAEPVLQPALATQQAQASAMNGLMGEGTGTAHLNGQGEEQSNEGAGADVEMKGMEEGP